MANGLPGRPRKNVNTEHCTCEATTPDVPVCNCANTEATLRDEIARLNAKCEQYEQVIQTTKKTQAELESLLKKATLEYNARIEYIVDCVKHAYMSIQFAINAGKNNNSEN